MKLQVICKGSTYQGLGHLFRILTFIKYIRSKCNVEVIAIVQKDLEIILSEIKEIVHFIRSDEQSIVFVKNFSPDVIVFDLTEFDEFIFNHIKDYVKITASISPVFNLNSNVDAVFTRSRYDKNIGNAKVFGGLKYAIFNENCETIPEYLYKRNLRRIHLPIAVAMGGTDAANKTLMVVNKLVEFPKQLTIWVTLGEGYLHSYNDLVTAINKNRNHEIILTKVSLSMWHILGNSVLAILAGGLTTIEAVYAGLPSINLYESQKHKDAVSKELFEEDIIQNGQFFSERSLDAMLDQIDFFYHNRNELLQIRQRSKHLIDKKGPIRVYEVIKSLVK